MWKTISASVGTVLLEAGGLMLLPQSPLIAWGMICIGILFLVWTVILFKRESPRNIWINPSFDEWVPLREAVPYVMQHLGIRGTTDADDGQLFMMALGELRQAGVDRAVTFRGNEEINRDMPGPAYKSVNTRIPGFYWERMEISPSCVDEAADEPDTRPDADNLGDRRADREVRYYNVVVNGRHMRNRWNKSAKKGII